MFSKRWESAQLDKSAKRILSENEVTDIKVDVVIEGPVRCLDFLSVS